MVREDTTLSNNKAFTILQRMVEDIVNWVGFYDHYGTKEEVSHCILDEILKLKALKNK